MKGVILAAGKGSRLFPVTHHIPKPLLPIANRMTLEYAFDQLKEMGVREICIVVGENAPHVHAALGDGSAFGVSLSYVTQTEPKGLAHAVGFAQEFVGDDSFVLYLGDAVYDRSLAEFARQFTSSGCDNLNLVKTVEDPRRFGVATLDGDRIVRLVEKPAEPESNYAMAGMYIFGPAIWEALVDLPPSARGELEITDAIQRLIDSGKDVRAGIYEGEWFDTGTLDSFLETSNFLTQGAVVAGENADFEATVGQHVVIGAGACVRAGMLEDCVVLPGAKVTVDGNIRHAVLGGTVNRSGDIQNEVVWG